jgi:uncharacterized MAPEG superfamily protein
MPDAGSVEMRMLACAIVLGLVQLTLAAFAAIYERGFSWVFGPRDEPAKPLGKVAGRLDRAYWNFLETFAFFAAAVLMAEALGRHTEWSGPGAQLYVAARALYVPAYVLGIPVLRTFIWTLALLGIVLVLMATWPG